MYKSATWKIVAPLFFVLSLLLGLFTPFNPTVNLKYSQAAAPEDAGIVYLPLVARGYPLRTPFGASLTLTTAGGLDKMVSAGLTWSRPFLRWSLVQPSEGAFNWTAVASLEQELRNAYAQGVGVILVIESTPTWALKSGYNCGAVATNKFPALAQFVSEAVRRYSQPPYHIKHFEFWNEPDVVNFLGCWGDENDTYYGGGYYGEMLKAVYPAAKAADSQAQVLVGGLLLDCDPRNPPSGKDCKPSRFLEGILRVGAGQSFDGVSFHSYDYYSGSLGQYNNPNWFTSWNTTGPSTTAKTGYLISLLTNPQFGAPGKYLMNTESALLCAGCTSSDQNFETTKAYYVPQAYAVSIANDLVNNLWYSVFGWNNSGLLINDSNLTERQAYHAFATASRSLQTTNLNGILNIAGIRGYEFSEGDRLIWVLWSTGGQVQVTIPGTPTAVYDVVGTPVSFTPGAPLPVSIKPVYVEWDP